MVAGSLHPQEEVVGWGEGGEGREKERKKDPFVEQPLVPPYVLPVGTSATLGVGG